MDFKTAIVYSLLLMMTLGACNDPTDIGSDLLEGDQVNVLFSDEIPVQISTSFSEQDSVSTYRSPRALASLLCGNFNDSIFGHAQSSLYIQPGLVFVPDNEFAELARERVDSLVLLLPYSTIGSYGDLRPEQTLEVYEVIEDLTTDGIFYSDQEFMTNPMPIGRVTQVLNPRDTVDFYDYSARDTIRFAHLRIRIDDETFLNDFITKISDTTNIQNDSIFHANVLQGLHIRGAEGEWHPGIAAFDLVTRDAGMVMYYQGEFDTNPGLDSVQYVFTVVGDNRTRVANFKHDYTDSYIEPFINNTSITDTMFVQSMAGVNGRVEFPDLTDFNDIIVNKAELELSILNVEEDSPFYTPVDQLILVEREDDGGVILIEDFENVISFGTGNVSSLGGTVIDTGNDRSIYRINISNHFQKILTGEKPPVIYVRASPKAERASRVVLGGEPGTPFATKLRLTYTRL